MFKCVGTAGEMAVKRVAISPGVGVTSLMDCVCMAKFRGGHPFVNSAIQLSATLDHVYIIQDLAVSDLTKVTPTEAQMKQWLFEVICAIEWLHGRGWIHGDVKAANVLLMPSGSIRLTDFGLSLRQDWVVGRCPQLCTSTHRPLEVWLGGRVTSVVDIWAFGCFAYEMAFSRNLFGGLESIQAWSVESLPTGGVNTLIRDVMEVDAGRRWPAERVKAHPYFAGLIEPVGSLVGPESREGVPRKSLKTGLPQSMEASIWALYGQIRDWTGMPNSEKLKTCIFMYSKLLAKDTVADHAIQGYERDVLKFLNYNIPIL